MQPVGRETVNQLFGSETLCDVSFFFRISRFSFQSMKLKKRNVRGSITYIWHAESWIFTFFTVKKLHFCFSLLFVPCYFIIFFFFVSCFLFFLFFSTYGPTFVWSLQTSGLGPDRRDIFGNNWSTDECWGLARNANLFISFYCTLQRESVLHHQKHCPEQFKRITLRSTVACIVPQSFHEDVWIWMHFFIFRLRGLHRLVKPSCQSFHEFCISLPSLPTRIIGESS